MTLATIEPASCTRQGHYTSIETAEIVGITYRMLDYWLRNRMITIADATPGTGNHRWFTAAEVEALKTVVGMYRTAQTIQRDFASGALWALTIAHHQREQELEAS